MRHQVAAAALMLGVAAPLTAAPGSRRTAAARPVKPPPAASVLPDGVVSVGQSVPLDSLRTPERPTVFVFIKPSSTLEASFLASLRKDAGTRAGVKAIYLKTGTEPVARQNEVTETPTALVYDRRGRLVARSSDADKIRAAVQKAAGVMRIDWAEEGDPRFDETTKVLGRPVTGGILRTMSLKPEYLDYINKLSRKAHFQDGYLPRRTKELIASYVSSLNKCKYWLGSHARFLQLQGQDQADVDAVGTLNLDSAKFTEKERSLLAFVKVLTLEPAKTRDADVERMRKAGWSDDEIFEASFITALFAFFNRMADAYGLDYPPNGWFPPDLRPAADPSRPDPASSPAGTKPVTAVPDSSAKKP